MTLRTTALRRAAYVCTIAVLSACVTPVERQRIETFVRKSSKGLTTIELDYLLYLPPGYDAPDARERRWPLLLFLHGIGECGSNPNEVARLGPPKRVEQGEDFPMIIVSPQNDGRLRKLWWNDLLIALLDHLETELRIDPDRVYLTGASLGGFGAWNLACVHPERFAAVAPVCGWGYPAEVRRMQDIPVWAFHGGEDWIVPIEEGRAMVDALRDAGGSARFTVYDDVGHGAWHRAYRDPELYEWLLAQRRGTAPGNGSTNRDP
ncbi:MAG: prolyl oligopeptidase family serine peptidase [Planctomycetes bacterium]|nr:prolyl oligopeptidase family serine peptidase [Planctomycetota bacterium]